MHYNALGIVLRVWRDNLRHVSKAIIRSCARAFFPIQQMWDLTWLIDKLNFAHAPQRLRVLFEVNNDCVVHTVQNLGHTCMSDMIGALGN